MPSPSMVSDTPLPPVQARPTALPPPPQPQHVYDEPPDTVGQARVRGSTTTATATVAGTSTVSSQPSTSSLPPQPSQQLAQSTPPSQALTVVVGTTSRTTDWRRRKREAEAMDSGNVKKLKVERKGYTCRVCGQPMNKSRLINYYSLLCTHTLYDFTATGHTQFKGQRYCPSNSSLSQEEWLAERRAEAATTSTAP